MHHAPEVDVHDPIESFILKFFDITRVSHPSVIDHMVNPVKTGGNIVGESIDVIFS